LRVTQAPIRRGYYRVDRDLSGYMHTHHTNGTVRTDGKLILENLPFNPGEEVEILLLSKQTLPNGGERAALEGSVLEYHDPFAPVAAEDWEALH
jgi:hypothetical protein